MGKNPENEAVHFWRDPDLPGLEVRFSSYHREAFTRHTHPAYSVGLLRSGRTVFFLDGELHRAEAGQLALIEPGRVHACNPDQDSNMTYYMFYVSESLVREVARDVLSSSLLPLFSRPVVDDPPLFDHWCRLHEAIVGGKPRLEKESLLVEGLAHLLSRHCGPEVAAPPVGDEGAVGVVRELLLDRVSEKVGLDELAGAAGLSRWHLLRVFRQSTGLPPHAYQTQLRVDLAKRLLAHGLPISRVAVDTGFADQSHLTRVFRRLTGATPRQYQNGRS